MRHGVPIVVEAPSDPEDDLSAVAASMGGVYVLGTVGRDQGVGPTTYLPRIHRRGLAVVWLCMLVKAQSCVCASLCAWLDGRYMVPYDKIVDTVVAITRNSSLWRLSDQDLTAWTRYRGQ
jgi:hypothetical protein